MELIQATLQVFYQTRSVLEAKYIEKNYSMDIIRNYINALKKKVAPTC